LRLPADFVGNGNLSFMFAVFRDALGGHSTRMPPPAQR
jgi:hypothetical protein